ncbi:MAG: prepilin peptidase [Lachnospiraceae bacterium]|nr:prepilin peptidase [Lachnospiraceae bacterium]
METNDFILLLVCCGAFGAVIGAYYGTIEYRIRNGGRLITSKCYCPACGHELALSMQIPVISWVLLKGRCYYCKAPVSVRYPLSEGAFLLFYCFSFLALNRHPLLMLLSWYAFTSIHLSVRCRGHFKPLLKGLLIMLLFHLVFGSVIAMVLLAL